MKVVLGRALVALAGLAVAGYAGWLIFTGLAGTPVTALPLPEEEFQVAPSVAVAAAASTPGEQPEMPNNSVAVPILSDTSFTITATTGFSSTEYEDLQGLIIPADPTEVAWFAGGAPLAGGDHGTTLLAAHIAVRDQRGAFWGADILQAGDIVFTKDAAGQTQRWAVTSVTSAHHTAFPQEYFSPDGERRLVLVTCGGELNEHGYYQYNIFVTATPLA